MTTDPEGAPEPAPHRRRIVPSARLRILFAVVGLLAFSAVLSTVLLREVLGARTTERIDSALTQESQELRRLAQDGRNPETGLPFGDDLGAMFDVFLARNVPAADETIFTFVDGAPFRASQDRPFPTPALDRVSALARATQATRGAIDIGGTNLRYVAVPVAAGATRGAFVVVADLARERRQDRDAVVVAAVVSAIALVLAAVIGFFVSGRILRPLRDATLTARAITETDLTRRVPEEGTGELAELSRTFNAMLDRIEGAFGSQRAFLSDAGHELRTPITIVRGHLELLGDDPQERAETMALVEDELDRMTRLVDDLLLLAKAERPDFLALEDLDLDVLSEELLAKARALADRDWRLEAVGHGRLTVDRQRLTQAVMNLANNAAQHTQPGDRIALGSALTPHAAQLWVRDTGPGVPAADRERVFERFARGVGGNRVPRREGSGLGLAITRAIAEAHGGEVGVENWAAAEGDGAIFTITIPIAPEEEPG